MRPLPPEAEPYMVRIAADPGDAALRREFASLLDSLGWTGAARAQRALASDKLAPIRHGHPDGRPEEWVWLEPMPSALFLAEQFPEVGRAIPPSIVWMTGPGESLFVPDPDALGGFASYRVYAFLFPVEAERALMEEWPDDPWPAWATPFLDSIAESPDDPATRLVFADWLEEQGRPGMAAAQRWMAAGNGPHDEAGDPDPVAWAWEPWDGLARPRGRGPSAAVLAPGGAYGRREWAEWALMEVWPDGVPAPPPDSPPDRAGRRKRRQ